MRRITPCYLWAAVLVRAIPVSKYIPDKPYLKMIYRGYIGKTLHLDNPKSYNEKIQWLKLYDRRPEYVTMVDKLEAKKYVSQIIGEEYIVPTLGAWDSADDIAFDILPDKFVLKTTHDSAGVVICKDKSAFNIKAARKKLGKGLKNNFWWKGREWPYKNVKPRILAEKYLDDHAEGGLRDYKFFCFDGKCKYMFIASDRFESGEETKFDFFDADYNFLDFRNGHPNSTIQPEKPKLFDEMKKLAEKLSAGIPHVRVDFYLVDEKIYFGELTFTHWSGLTPFEPEEWDYKFGEHIKLQSIQGKED